MTCVYLGVVAPCPPSEAWTYARQGARPARQTPAAASPAADGPWLRPVDAARLASVSRRTLDRWLSTGLVRASRVGGVVRVERASLDRLLREASGENF